MNQKPFRYEGDLLSVMNNATVLPEAVSLLVNMPFVDHHPKCLYHVFIWFCHRVSPESRHLRECDHQ